MGAESKPSYQPLFTNLQSSDAGAITQQLASQKIPYQLADGGSTVLVPAADVDQERIALAQQGLPQAGNVGFSNLEKSGITTSEFVQQVEYQQALEGQLEQTISSIQGVQSAQVNLVVPQQSDFAVGTQQATTASILVNLSPGHSALVGPGQRHRPPGGVVGPGLSSSDVTVVDNHGDVLTAPGDAGGTSGASNTQQTNAYDNQLAASLTALLDRVVGEGNAAVQVNALLNFNQSQTTTNGLQLNAQGQPVTAPTGQTTSNSTYSGTGTPPSGVLGSSQPLDDHRRERHVHDHQFPGHQRGGPGHPDREAGPGPGGTDVGRSAAQFVQGQEGQPGAGPVAGDRCRRLEHGQRGPARRHVHALRVGSELPERRGSPPPPPRHTASSSWSTPARSAASCS